MDAGEFFGGNDLWEDVAQKLESLGIPADPNERNKLYHELAWALTNGIPLSEEEVSLLAFGVWNDPRTYAMNPHGEAIDARVNDWVTYQSINEALKQRESFSPGSTQIELWDHWNEPEQLDSIKVKEPNLLYEAFKGTVIGAAALAGIVGAASLGGSATGAAIGSRLGSLASKAGGLGGILKFLWKHKWGTAGLGLGAFGLGATLQGAGDEYVDENGSLYGPDAGNADGEDTVLLTDPATGETVEIPVSQLSATGLDVNGAGVPTAPAADLSSDLMQYIQSYNLDPSMVTLNGQNQAAWNPLIYGSADVSASKFPTGIDLSGEPLSRVPSASPMITGRVSAATTPSTPSDAGERHVPGAMYDPNYSSGQGMSPTTPPLADPNYDERNLARGYYVKPGAEIAPNAFSSWDGQTLLQRAARAATSFGVPLEILYGLVNQESGWDPNAVGDNGNSFGLVQIYLPAHPEITSSMARNPQFALNWAARNLKNNFQTYGSWELAVVAHRSPVGAQYLSQNGEFKEPIDQAYLNNIITYAANSSLGHSVFGGSESFLNSGVAAVAAPVPPYVAPDPATLGEFVTATYADEYKREPTEGEKKSQIERLQQIYREAYNESIKAYRGGESVDIDPEARFREELSATGEAQFRESVGQRRSMFEYMGNVANILRSV